MIEVDDARVSSILSTKRKRMLVIDLDKLYVLNKSSSERVIFYNNNYTFSWNCINRHCTGRANSQREELEGADIHVTLTRGIFYFIVF
jgi:hypothetical protein